MFWALDLDDFKGTQCNEGKYPLITAVAVALGDYTPPPPGTPGPRPPPTKAPITDKPGKTDRPIKTEAPSGKCHAIGSFKGDANMDAYCVSNCGNKPRYCPENICASTC